MQLCRSLPACIALGVTLVACGSGSATQPADARVTITLNKSTYGPGDTVYYTTHATNGGDLYNNTCHGALEKLASSVWTRVQNGGEPANCGNFHIKSIFDNGGTAGIIPTSATAGTYRYVLDWIAVGSETSVLSEDERRTPTFSVVVR